MNRLYILLLIIFQSTICFAQKHNAELIYKEENIKIKNGVLYKDFIYKIEINNRKGDIYNNISIAYSKLNKLSNIKASITDKNGKLIKELKRSNITSRSAISSISFYEDQYIKEFSLRHNTYPYTITYSYKLKQKEFLYIDYWTPILSYRIPTRKAVLNLEVPKGYILTQKSKLTDKFTVDSLESTIKYKWTASYQDLLKSELYSPAKISNIPSVILVPQNYKYEVKGSNKTWKSYGNWQYELIKDITGLPQKEKDKISELIKGITNEKEKIKTLYHYLQKETRYINISIETGGLKPYPASYVAKNKYGDCKALTNYFRSILKHIGIKSHYAKIHAGGKIKDIDKSIPSQQFNHAILCVPLKQDTLWIDCTSDNAFGYIGTFIQGRDIFLIDKDNSHFTKTPILSCTKVLNTKRIKIHLNKDNEAILSCKNIYQADNYETLSYISNSLKASRKPQIVSEYYTEDGFENIDYRINNENKDSTKIHLDYTAKSRKTYKQYGDDYLVKLLNMDIPLFEDLKERTQSIQIDYPTYEIDTIEYDCPQNYQFSEIPKLIKINSKYGQYQIEYHLDKDKLQVYKSFKLLAGKYKKDEYNDFYSFISRIYTNENKKYIVIEKQ